MVYPNKSLPITQEQTPVPYKVRASGLNTKNHSNLYCYPMVETSNEPLTYIHEYLKFMARSY